MLFPTHWPWCAGGSTRFSAVRPCHHEFSPSSPTIHHCFGRQVHCQLSCRMASTQTLAVQAIPRDVACKPTLCSENLAVVSRARESTQQDLSSGNSDEGRGSLCHTHTGTRGQGPRQAPNTQAHTGRRPVVSWVNSLLIWERTQLLPYFFRQVYNWSETDQSETIVFICVGLYFPELFSDMPGQTENSGPYLAMPNHGAPELWWMCFLMRGMVSHKNGERHNAASCAANKKFLIGPAYPKTKFRQI